MIRHYNWCFTSFRLPEIDIDRVAYIIWQQESCPKTARDHWQGYVEFYQKQSLKSAKKLFNDHSIHLEVRRGTQKQAIDYCQKLETAVSKPVIIGKPKRTGTRNDLDAMYDMIESGNTIAQCLREFRGNGLRHVHCMARAQQAVFLPSKLDQMLLQAQELDLQHDPENCPEVTGNTDLSPDTGHDEDAMSTDDEDYEEDC